MLVRKVRVRSGGWVSCRGPTPAVALLGFAVLVLICPSAASGRTLRVAKDGSGQYSVIQDAVNAAVYGDTIFIAAGRYAESRVTLAWYPPEREACVVVPVDNLTLIGEDPETVIIGPETYTYWNYGPVGIGAVTASVSFMRVERVGLVNNYMHIDKNGGAIEVRGCRMRGSGDGVFLLNAQGGLIENIHVEDCDGGIILHTCNGTVVRGCQLTRAARVGRAAINLMTSTGISIMDCTASESYTGIGVSWSSAQLIRCHVLSHLGNGISIFGRGTEVLMQECVSDGSPYGLVVDASATVHGSRNIFSGTSGSVGFRQGTVSLRNCHILNGGGWSVELNDDIRYNPGTYDLTGNWWGTTDSEQIAAWIYDANDRPQVGAVVEYIPFLDGPTGTEAKTLGGIKGMFR